MRRGVGVAALLIAACLPAGASAQAPGPTRYLDEVFSSVDVQRDIAYGSAPDNQGNPVELRLDLYQPAGDTELRRPALIVVHGGGFAVGSKSDSSVVDVATTFARLGYATASINYRLLAGAGCGGQPDPSSECVTAARAAQHDAQAAVRWLRANATAYRIDVGRIAMSGFSAGAVTSLLVGTDSQNAGDSGNPGFPSWIRSTVSYCGGLPTNETISADDAPTIFFHGTADTTVPYAWAESNYHAFQAVGVPTELHPFEGAGHCVPYTEQRDFILGATKSFLYTNMDLPPKPSCDTPFDGTDAGDSLTGTAFGDRIVGGAGDDDLEGLSGDDCLSGEDGDDRLDGGDGRDSLDGGPGADRLAARDGERDRVRCGPGRGDRAKVDRRDRVRGCERVVEPRGAGH
ncbi:MAG TPA: CocE/NonD family hydrolase [Solirubrobacterales bacterium]|nr:CocE/NonD family hydrolase [Solirubrobacterales bacterium]